MFGSDHDVSPEVLAKRSNNKTLTGADADPIADVPISTGDAVVDEWEREEFADPTPIRFIDGPASIPGSPTKLLARYLAPR